MAIHGADPSSKFSCFKEKHRTLFSLYKKGLLSVEDALQLVREGKDAKDFLKTHSSINNQGSLRERFFGGIFHGLTLPFNKKI